MAAERCDHCKWNNTQSDLFKFIAQCKKHSYTNFHMGCLKGCYVTGDCEHFHGQVFSRTFFSIHFIHIIMHTIKFFRQSWVRVACEVFSTNTLKASSIQCYTHVGVWQNYINCLSPDARISSTYKYYGTRCYIRFYLAYRHRVSLVVERLRRLY